MHQTHQYSATGNPKTRGGTLHKASQYDFHTQLLGLEVNQTNSRMIAEMANIKPGDTVLDVGSGSGNFTLTAKRYAGSSGLVYGIDASPEMIDLARKKASQSDQHVVFDVGLIENLPFVEAIFDIVINRLAIHHLSDDLKHQAFAVIFRVLKRGGILFVADFKAPTNPILADVTSLFIGHPVMMQSNVLNLRPMLSEAGFSDIASGPTRSAFLAFVRGKKN